MFQKVEFKTEDNVKIVADYFEPDKASSHGIILLHMMPATKESWRALSEKLQQAGWQVLAIDLRGHGSSGGGDYRKFSDAEHQASMFDLKAAHEFLKTKGASEVFVGGASIGANLSLWYLAEHSEVRAAVLLSPGVDYRGIKIESLAKQIAERNKILFVGSEDDASVMGDGCEGILRRLGSVQKICYGSGGHGTNLFDSHPELLEKILDFLKVRF